MEYAFPCPLWSSRIEPEHSLNSEIEIFDDICRFTQNSQFRHLYSYMRIFFYPFKKSISSDQLGLTLFFLNYIQLQGFYQIHLDKNNLLKETQLINIQQSLFFYLMNCVHLSLLGFYPETWQVCKLSINLVTLAERHKTSWG